MPLCLDRVDLPLFGLADMDMSSKLSLEILSDRESVSLQASLIIDPLTDSARFDVRNQTGADPDTARAIRFTVKKTSTGATVREQVYDWATLVGL